MTLADRLERADPPSARTTGPLAGPGIVFVLAALVFTRDLARPSAWRDEAATVAVARRSIPGIFEVTRHTDLVHRGYYVLAHLSGLSLQPFGVGWLTAARCVDALAMALAAAALVRLGRALAATEVGVVAALLLVASPVASRYAQEARPYAVVTLTATLTSCALVSALQRPGSHRHWVVYAGGLVVTGALSVIALLLVGAHAAYLVLRGRRQLGRWLIAVGSALVLLGPFLVAASRQRAQVAWLRTPHWRDLRSFYADQVDHSWLVPLTLLLVLAVLHAAPAAPGRRSTVSGDGLAFGVCWGVVPPVLLWCGSQAHPLWDGRYVVFTVPGLALAAASVIAPASAGRLVGSEDGPRPPARVHRLALLTVVAVTAASGWPQQQAIRRPAGHGEDLRGAARLLAGRAHPGDAVLYLPGVLRIVAETYPRDFGGLDDIALAGRPGATSTLAGLDVSPSALSHRLEGRPRVWVLGSRRGLDAAITPLDQAKAMALRDRFHVESTTMFRWATVTLYQAD